MFAAVARVVAGKGLVRVNGTPVKLFAAEVLRAKLYEPILLLGVDKFASVDIRVRVTGGGHVSQVYAVRQAVSPPRPRETSKKVTANHVSHADCQGNCQSTKSSELVAQLSSPTRPRLTAKLQISYYAKYVDEHTKNQLKTILIAFDRSLLVADPRRCEPKKFGGKGARSRFQKSYR